MTTSSISCQEFSQNAWKKDFCSNCFKPRNDHDVIARSNNKSASLKCHMNGLINNNNNNNNVIEKWTTSVLPPKKIGTNGVLLWEVGHSVIGVQNKKDQVNGNFTKQSSSNSHVTNGETQGSKDFQRSSGVSRVSNGVPNGVDKVQSILRDKSIENNNFSSIERRSSVEFLDGSPKVIGYGGNDYESEESSDDEDDELSDVDSLETFNLSEEDKAFNQLTDLNTEFNADNSNLLSDGKNLRIKVSKSQAISGPSEPCNDVENKLSRNLLYSMPIKSMAKLQDGHPKTSIGEDVNIEKSQPPPHPLSPPPISPYAASNSANAQEFIRSNLFSNSLSSTSDPEEFLDVEEFSSGISTRMDNDHRPNGKGHKIEPQSGVKVGFQSVPVRNFPTERVSVQDLFREEPITAAERRAAFKNSIPIATKHSRNGISPQNNLRQTPLKEKCSPYGVVAVSDSTSRPCESTKSNIAPQIPLCPPPDSDDESQRLPVDTKRAELNQKSHFNDSCHYASSNVTTTKPITSPYSSPAALNNKSPTISSQKPPVTKPKPKLPAKPSLLIKNQSPKSPNRTSIVYQEIEDNPPVTMESTQTVKTGGSSDSTCSNESKQSPSLTNSADGNQRRVVPKRRAPKPPKEAPVVSQQANDANRKLSTCSLSNLKELASVKTPTANKSSSRSYTLNNTTSVISLESYCCKGIPTLDNEDCGNQRANTLSVSPKEAKLKKSRFSLKKLLKFGTSKDGHDDDVKPKSDHRRDKLEILHPIDLMKNNAIDTEDQGNDHGDQLENGHLKSTPELLSPSESLNDKPPPPRRLRAQEKEELIVREKPIRPPPPVKTVYRQNAVSSLDELDRSVSPSRVYNEGSNLDGDNRKLSNDTSMDYANLGDVRNSVLPKKPGRCTSSMSDITADLADYGKQFSESQNSLDNYEQPDENNEPVTYYSPPSPNEEAWPTEDEEDDTELYADQAVLQHDSNDHSQPSSFTSEVMSAIASRSSSSSGQNPIVGSPCKVYEVVVVRGKNLEKVYSAPTRFSQQDETDIDDLRTPDVPWSPKKSSRLSMRKAKSVVHKNLEDNYGAVVSANHQTLTQILDQVSQSQHSKTNKLKALDEAPLRWASFTLVEDSKVMVVETLAFYSATFQSNLEVTLMVSPEPLNSTIHSVRNPCVLQPEAEFEDHIPTEYIFDERNSTPTKTASVDIKRRANVWIIDRMQVNNFPGIVEYLKAISESDFESYERESCFMLLQLINGLKHLQAQGTEEVESNMDDFVLVKNDQDINYRFLILPKGTRNSFHYNSNDRNNLSLCQCALKAMLMLFCAPNWSPQNKTETRLEELELLSTKPSFRMIGDILMQERATSLSQAKLLLEYMIWGPSDQLCTSDEMTTQIDQENAYQRWLDLERATVLNNLIRTQSLWQIRLTVFEEYMLSFLVRTCAKTLRDAAVQLQMATNRKN